MESPESPRTLDDADAGRLADLERLAAGCREAARRTLAFARRYREEEGAPDGERERACIAQALAWRQTAREMRAGRSVAAPRPGLARARGTSTVTGSQRTG